jgi:hypothetical protein
MNEYIETAFAFHNRFSFSPNVCLSTFRLGIGCVSRLSTDSGFSAPSQRSRLLYNRFFR